MSYLGLNIDSVCWETKSLMSNNYGKDVTIDNFEELFNNAKNDILKTCKDIIEDNKDFILEEFEESLKEIEEIENG